MTPGRTFSDEELRIAGMRSIDAIREALEAGNHEDAKRFARRLRREALAMVASYDGWEATLQEVLVERGVRDVALRDIEDAELAPERLRLASDGAAWRELADQIAVAIEGRDDARALELAERLHDEALASHDRGLSRVSALLSWIARHVGSEAIEEALGRAMNSGMLGDAGFRERAEALMHFTRVHLQAFELEEDEEKLTFQCSVCPSAGRLLRNGHYDPPMDGHWVEGPSPLTYGRDRLPAYCCHEPVMERASIAETGAPLFIVEPSENLGVEPCKTYLYKDAAKIPTRFYTRLGLKKLS